MKQSQPIVDAAVTFSKSMAAVNVGRSAAATHSLQVKLHALDVKPLPLQPYKGFC